MLLISNTTHSTDLIPSSASGFNAKSMFVAESVSEDSDDRSRSELKIYDLEAVKNPKSTDNDLLVPTIAVKLETFSV